MKYLPVFMLALGLATGGCGSSRNPAATGGGGRGGNPGAAGTGGATAGTAGAASATATGGGLAGSTGTGGAAAGTGGGLAGSTGIGGAAAGTGGGLAGSTGTGGAAAGTGGGPAGAGGGMADAGAGAGGSAGAGGGAGGVGSISACFPTTISFNSPCAVTCGNGSIDSCMYTTPCPASAGQVCPMATFTETCDGSALGANSCASLGFAGGTLRCGPWCGFDSRGCDACEHGAAITGCVSAAPEVAIPLALRLAATDTEIALAWLDGEVSGSRTGLRFARFRPDLTRLSLSECFGPAGATQTALAATPSGWLLAATAPDGLHILALGPTGTQVGQDRVIAGEKDPLLVARPTGGPLLYWTATSQTFVKLLRADGSDETPAVATFPYVIDTSAGVFTGDGFLVASRLAQLVTTRIDLDGKVAKQTTIPTSLKPNGYAPGLAWNGTDAAVTFYVGDGSDTGGSMTGGSFVGLQRVDRLGAPTAAFTVVGAFAHEPDSNPPAGALIAPLGGLAIVVRRPNASTLEAARIDGVGAPVVAAFGLAHDPGYLRAFQLGTRGPDAVVAWITEGFRLDTPWLPGRIGLARIAP